MSTNEIYTIDLLPLEKYLQPTGLIYKNYNRVKVEKAETVLQELETNLDELVKYINTTIFYREYSSYELNISQLAFLFCLKNTLDTLRYSMKKRLEGGFSVIDIVPINKKAFRKSFLPRDQQCVFLNAYSFLEKERKLGFFSIENNDRLKELCTSIQNKASNIVSVLMAKIEEVYSSIFLTPSPFIYK